MNSTKETTVKLSLYERLGGEKGLKKIVNDALDRNLKNPKIGHHFQKVDMPKLKRLVFEFFSMGTGGPHQYTGRDMTSSHADLKITKADFLQSNDDVLKALQENGVGEAEQKEVIAILDSMRGDVIRA